jgi:uncharacterized protein (TIGR03083 family)
VPLDAQVYLAHITADSDALATAIESSSPDTPVGSCPEWTLRDLAGHVGVVQRWAAGIVATTAQERPSRGDPPELADAAACGVWLREGVAELVAALESADASAPLWTFTFDRKLSFWFRRQAQEVSIHRWDAQDATGVATPIDGALAADGIDEWLDLLAVRGAATERAEHTVHLHCTDVDGEWLVRRSADGLDIERAHAKGDVAARGTASDLDLYVWGRVGPEHLELFGDADLLEVLRRAGPER